MGINASTRVFNNTTKTVVQNSMALMSTISNENSSIASSSQTIIVNVAGKVSCGGSLRVINESATTVSALSQITSQQMADLKTKIKEDYETQLKFETEQENSTFIPSFNMNNEIVNMFNETSAKTDSEIETTLRNVISQTANTTQAIQFNVLETGVVEVGADCIYKNDQITEMVSSNIADAVTQVLQGSETYKKYKTEIESSVKQSNTLSMGFIILIIMIVVICAVAGVLGKLAHDGKLGKKGGKKIG